MTGKLKHLSGKLCPSRLPQNLSSCPFPCSEVRHSNAAFKKCICIEKQICKILSISKAILISTVYLLFGGLFFKQQSFNASILESSRQQNTTGLNGEATHSKSDRSSKRTLQSTAKFFLCVYYPLGSHILHIRSAQEIFSDSWGNLKI